MKEGGGRTDDDQVVDQNDVNVEVELGNGGEDGGNRTSNIGMSNQKMKPNFGGDGLSPERNGSDLFSGAVGHGRSDDAPVQEFGSGTASAEFKKHFFFGKKCTCFRRVINYIGAIAALLNVSLDIVYATKVTYSLRLIYILTCLFIISRIMVTLGFGQYYYNKFVRNYRTQSLGGLGENKDADENEQEEVDEKNKSGSKKQAEIKNQGMTLYSSLHLLYYTGFYRVLPSSDFKYELAVGYSIELFLTTIPMLFCQVFNNSSTPREGNLRAIQSVALLMKLFSLIILIVELVMLIWEVKKNYDMRKLGISRQKLTEEQRRYKYARIMAVNAIVSMVLFLVILVAASASNKPRQCTERQALE